MKRVSEQEFRALATEDLRGLFNATWSATIHRDDLSLRESGFQKWIREGNGRRALEEKLAQGLLWTGDDWVASPAYAAAVERLEQKAATVVAADVRNVGTAKCAKCGVTRGITDDEDGIADLNREGWRTTGSTLYCSRCTPPWAHALTAIVPS